MSNTDEITLNSVRYAIDGPVQVSGDSRFAQKMVTGDFTKDSDKRRSSHTWSDLRGGCFLKNMKEGTEDDHRTYWNTCNTDYPDNIILGPLNTSCGTVATSVVSSMVEAKGVLYVTMGEGLYFWRHNDLGWGTVIYGTINGGVTDAIYFDGYIFLGISGTDFLRHTVGSESLSFGVSLGGAKECKYFTIWDDKLYAIDNDGQLKYTDDYGATWTDDAKLHLDRDSVTGLIVYTDVSGNDIIYAGTKYGLYAHDADNAKFVQTNFTFPKHDYGCAGMTVFREALYVSVGMDVYEYKMVGDGVILTPIGMQYGMASPISYTGSIVRLVSSYNHLYAMVDATAATDRELYVGNPLSGTVVPGSTGYSFVAQWNAHGWTIVKIGSSTATPPGQMVVSRQENKYRLYFDMGGNVYRQDLENVLVNPIRVGNYEHESAGELVTPWFDGNNDTASKTALRTLGYATGCSANEKITITYQINNAAYTDAWTAHATVTSSGAIEQSFGSGAGIEYYNIRYKLTLARGSTTTKTPNLHFLTHEYIKVPDGIYDYQITIDMNRSAGSNSAETRMAALKTAYDTKTLVQFSYDDATTTTPKRVIVESFQAVEKAGKYQDGLYRVNLIEA